MSAPDRRKLVVLVVLAAVTAWVVGSNLAFGGFESAGLWGRWVEAFGLTWKHLLRSIVLYLVVPVAGVVAVSFGVHFAARSRGRKRPVSSAVKAPRKRDVRSARNAWLAQTYGVVAPLLGWPEQIFDPRYMPAVPADAWRGPVPTQCFLEWRAGLALDLETFEAAIRERVWCAPGWRWAFHYWPQQNLVELAAEPVPEPLPTDVSWPEHVAHETAVIVGLAEDGWVWHDVAVLPHALYAGRTRRGKTMALRTAIAGRLLAGWTVRLCDPKRVELLDFIGRPGVADVAISLEGIADLLEAAYDDMMDRYTRAQQSGRAIGELVEAEGRVLVVVDELAALLVPGRHEDKERKTLRASCEWHLGQLAQLGAAGGFHLLLSTQYPRDDVLPRTISLNVEARLLVGRLDSAGSHLVLESGEGAAAGPVIPGRGLWKAPDGGLVAVQGLHTSAGVLGRLVPAQRPRGAMLSAADELVNQRPAAAGSGWLDLALDEIETDTKVELELS